MWAVYRSVCIINMRNSSICVMMCILSICVTHGSVLLDLSGLYVLGGWGVGGEKKGRQVYLHVMIVVMITMTW